MLRRRALALALAVAASITGCCSCGDAGPGAALGGIPAAYVIGPMKPGDQLGLLYVPLINAGRTPVIIKSVRLDGRGIGTVIRVRQIKFAAGDGSNTLRSGAYSTDPPAALIQHICHIQRLIPVRNRTIAPGMIATFWVAIQAIREGRFDIAANTIEYRQDGHVYRQTISVGYRGEVSASAPYIAPARAQLACLKQARAKLLPQALNHQP